MYIGLTQEQEALRQEVRAYFEDLLSPEVRESLKGSQGTVSYTHLTLPTILRV